MWSGVCVRLCGMCAGWCVVYVWCVHVCYLCGVVCDVCVLGSVWCVCVCVLSVCYVCWVVCVCVCKTITKRSHDFKKEQGGRGRICGKKRKRKK